MSNEIRRQLLDTNKTELFAKYPISIPTDIEFPVYRSSKRVSIYLESKLPILSMENFAESFHMEACATQTSGLIKIGNDKIYFELVVYTDYIPHLLAHINLETTTEYHSYHIIFDQPTQDQDPHLSIYKSC